MAFTHPDFRLLESRPLKEEQSVLHLYEHAATGARVLYMENDDLNKVFSIGFRTPPIGSTGNCHILEHCVLNGSRKYRTKEPFMDLIKSSLATFLNAITYPDKTIYPVASRNDADFANLMDLYLDAVFYPRAVEDPLIFRQEGWRYEIFDKSEPLTYKGVVYNEMKGAMSSGEDQVYEQIGQNLFPGTIYAENSGGDPYVIPELDYETFRAYHSRYYAPTNSYTFLYGKIDEAGCFNRLAEYFNAFPRRDAGSMPERCELFSEPRRATCSYATGAGEDPEGRAFLSMSWIIDDISNVKDRLVYQLLSELLVDSEASPLRRRLLKEIGCEDIYSGLNIFRQVGFSIIAKNAPADKLDLFESVVLDELKKLVENGISPELLDATMNVAEYRLREKGNYATKGIIFLTAAMTPWLYDEDPMLGLAYRDELDDLKARLHEGVFEDYIRGHLVENPHRVLILHEPAPGLNEKRDLEVREALDDLKSQMSDEELDELIAENQALLERQNAPDSEEQKKTIPVLTRDELPKSFPRIPRELFEDEATWLYHELPTAGIHYLDLVFDASHIGTQEAAQMALVCELIGMLDTRKHTYSDYANAEMLATGGITANPRLYAHASAPRRFERKVVISTKLLGTDHLREALELIREQLFDTLFEDRERIVEVIRMVKSEFQADLLQNGHRIVRDRAQSQVSALSHYNQFLNGLDFYKYVTRLSERYTDEDHDALVAVYKKLFINEHRIVNITSDAPFEELAGPVRDMLRTLPAETPARVSIDFTPYEVAEAFVTSSDVQYVSRASNLRRLLPDATQGSLAVLAGILSNEYLYNEIRAKGGAYGAGLGISWTGIASTYSYRDPNLRRTVEVYEGLGDAVEALELTPQDLDRFLIGAIGTLDEPMTERRKGGFDLSNFLSGRTPESYDRLLSEALATTFDQLKSYADGIGASMSGRGLVVLGSEKAISEAKDLFDRVERI